jgi:hypothetical protein
MGLIAWFFILLVVLFTDTLPVLLGATALSSLLLGLACLPHALPPWLPSRRPFKTRGEKTSYRVLTGFLIIVGLIGSIGFLVPSVEFFLSGR